MLCFKAETLHAKVNYGLALFYFIAGFSFFITMFMPGSKTGCFDVDNCLWLGGGYLVVFSVLIFLFAVRSDTQASCMGLREMETALMMLTLVVLCVVNIILVVNLSAFSSNEDTACIQKSNNPLIACMIIFTAPLIAWSAFYSCCAVWKSKTQGGGQSGPFKETGAEFQTLLL